jgi:uncharacterized RDD family membrane protein YckC
MKQLPEFTKDIGIYYEPKDYAGLLKRSITWIIDIVVLGTSFTILWFILYFTISEEIVAIKIAFWTFFLITYIYLSILKPSKFRTIGYLATGIKIVDLYGNKPSWNTMITRFFLLGFSPLAFIIDILWLTGEQTKQTLRDKYVGTYVVDNNAIPQGNAPFQRVVLNFLGWNLIYKEIELKNHKNKN